jgi:hypothetical protein
MTLLCASTLYFDLLQTCILIYEKSEHINVTDDNITVFLPFVHVAIFVLLVDLLLNVGTVNAHIPFVTSALIWGDTFTVLA